MDATTAMHTVQLGPLRPTIITLLEQIDCKINRNKYVYTYDCNKKIIYSNSYYY